MDSLNIHSIKGLYERFKLVTSDVKKDILVREKKIIKQSIDKVDTIEHHKFIYGLIYLYKMEFDSDTTDVYNEKSSEDGITSWNIDDLPVQLKHILKEYISQI